MSRGEPFLGKGATDGASEDGEEHPQLAQWTFQGSSPALAPPSTHSSPSIPHEEGGWSLSLTQIGPPARANFALSPSHQRG